MWAESWLGFTPMHKLTVKQLAKLFEPGRVGDGGGLWFQVRKPDPGAKPGTAPSRSWAFRYTWKGRQRQMGLGPYPDVGLAEARDLATAARAEIRAGRNPIGEKKVKKAAAAADEPMTFDNVVERYLAANKVAWTNDQHAKEWQRSMEVHVTPVFGKWPVRAVDTAAVMRVIQPYWKTKTETASRVRGRIETVLNYATSMGWRTGDNPARWRGHLKNLLPPPAKVAKVQHLPALPWAQVGAFMAALAQQTGTGALALRFTILTAARTGEVIGAQWSEIDLAAGTWVVPGDRMKAGNEHRVPLTDAAIAILRQMLPARPETGDGYVFPGGKKDAGLTQSAMLGVLRRMGRDDTTVHGFRSSFRDWVGESTSFPTDLAEACLAHAVKGKTEAAYARGDLFVKRRKLMESWAAFCATVEARSGKVVSIGQGEAA
jgi:integrase